MKKIQIKIYIGILAVCTALFNLTSCMDDDLVKNSSKVEEGVPITVSLNFAAIPSTDVAITRASGSDLSDLSDVVICVFHGDGSFEQMVTNYNSTSLTKDDETIGDNGEKRYSVSFESTSGEKKLIALANVADGAFWENMITDLTAAYNGKYSFDQVKAIVADVSHKLVAQAGTTDGMQPFHITASSQMLITGWNEGVVFGTGNSGVTDYGKYGDKDNSVAIKMKRAMAHVTFNITASPTNAKGTFTPSSFRVYNIPTKSYLTNDLQGSESYAPTTGVTDVSYVYTAAENIGTAQGGYYSFNFYMPENVQKNESVSTYNDRDAWSGDEGASPEKKTWTNAPQNSTFVVISGTYEGSATIDDTEKPVTANVEYTIHLGDFGKSTDDSRNYGDFSVMRNYSYTYTVNVLGVDKIIVEAQRAGGEEYQNGAEGSIYDSGSTLYTYNLDAHYEQVYLEYNLSDIANSLGQGLTGQDLDDAIANQLILIIQSEAMDYTHDYTDDKPYTTRNKRGTLSPYKIYADAVRKGTEDDAAKAKADVLDGEGEAANPTKGFDYKWIEFLPQSGTTISAYPGISSWAMENLDGLKNSQFYAGATGTSNMLDVYDVVVEMGKAIKKIYLEGAANSDKIVISQSGDNYVARFTAFVNEYYYLRHPLTGAATTTWSVITNKIPREMIIAMSTETSDDGNSSYSKIHSYISQLSMETFYNDRVTSLNAFGIETYNETPLTYEFGDPESEYNLSDTDGRENQKKLIGASSTSTPYWSTYITASGNGWTSSVGTERTDHKLPNAYSMKAAYSACMSRNRDLNGNGRIDENEIRWYLASLNEYIRIGIGNNALSSAQLFFGDKDNLSNYPSNDIKNGSLYYTSSESGKRVYWAIEKGSYGAVGDYYDGSSLPIRCIRDLPATGTSTDVSSIDGVKSDATYKYYDNLSPKLLVFKDRLVSSLYRQRASGSLLVHNEDEDPNSFYDGIFVAEDFLYTENYWGDKTYRTFTLGNIIGYNGTVTWSGGRYSNNGTMTNPCSSHTEGGYTDWRVPNLVELSAMNAAGLLSPKPDGYGDNDVACCTQFTNQSVRYGFAFSSLIYCPGAETQQINNQVLIRCVRDVPANFTFPTN
ncbi:MAG: DUF4906 domain-containing protein [Bacteroides sp.]|nr:DUF4906 domain-containing protein [Bacteroides sp.]